MKARDNTLGFTLIELLVVISIIGLLASVVLSSLNSARVKARDTKRVSEMKSLQKALELYYHDKSYYPTMSWVRSNNSSQWNTLGAELAPYMPNMPIDPINAAGNAYSGALSYSYYATGSFNVNGRAQGYMIVFTLEEANEELERQDGSTRCSSNYTYNYGGEDGYIITLGGDCVQPQY